jgi:hypothetical protein
MGIENNGLDFGVVDPSQEIGVTQDIFSGVSSAVPVAVDENSTQINQPDKVLTDYKGRTFDPAIHMADENGKPLVSHGNIRLKKPSLRKRVTDFLSGEKTEKGDFAKEKREVPLSDHEKEAEIQENLKEAERQAAFVSDLEAHSEDAANTMWVVYSATLGPEALNQYEKLHPKLKKHFELFERRTGKSVDLPPGVSLAIGVATVGFEIVRAEPECKKRFDKAKDVVASNLGGYAKKFFAAPDDEKTPIEKDQEAGEND